MSNSSPSLPRDTVESWARLIRAAQSTLAAVERDVKRAGFPPLAWYDALLELRRAGAKGLRPFELQAVMLLAQYNLSRLTDRLTDSGYVERRPCPEDGRGQVLAITATGEDLLKSMWPAYRSAIATHFAERLGPDDAANLGIILTRLI